MKLGIVGLPNVGKSTLFNSMTLGKAEAANYPFCTIDPNVGVVPVPDERLARLTEMYDSAKTTPAVIEFVDIAGLVRGASKGEGLGNKFLSHIREVDAICHVVRCFEDTNVVHVDGSIDPIRDIETINLELIFSDIEILERRISKTVKLAKQDKSLQRELDILLKLKEALEAGKSARSVEFDAPEDYEFVQTLTLLTAKPVLYAANVTEDDLADDGASNEFVGRVREYAAAEHNEVFVLCAKIEEEISDLDEADKKEFLRACRKGFDFMKENPEEALQILLDHQNEENFPLSKTVETKSMEILLPVMETEDAKFLSQDVSVWQNNADWMYENGILKEKADVSFLVKNLLDE